MLAVVDAKLARKGASAVVPSQRCISCDTMNPNRSSCGSGCPLRIDACWNISGNEASGVGAIRGGVRFVAAYPITGNRDAGVARTQSGQWGRAAAGQTNWPPVNMIIERIFRWCALDQAATSAPASA